MKKDKLVLFATFLLIALAIVGGIAVISSSGTSDEESSSPDRYSGPISLSVHIPEKYEQLRAGEVLYFEVKIKNVEASGRHDIQLEYYIKKNGIVINDKKELKAIETQASFLSSIKVPEEAVPALYDVEVIVNEESSAEESFVVKTSELGNLKTYLLLIFVAILVVGGMVVFELNKLVNTKKK